MHLLLCLLVGEEGSMLGAVVAVVAVIAVLGLHTSSSIECIHYSD